jgi:hypothetical protein
MPKHLLLECKLYNTERKHLKKEIQPLPLTWQMVIHTTRGLQATMTFFQNMGAETRSWQIGTRDMSTDNAGWMEFECEQDERARSSGEEYLEEEGGDRVGFVFFISFILH